MTLKSNKTKLITLIETIKSEDESSDDDNRETKDNFSTEDKAKSKTNEEETLKVEIESSDDNAETDSDNSSKEANTDDEGTAETNTGWVDSVAKILKTKKPKGKKTIVLSKAKKLTEVKVKKPQKNLGFQIDGEIKDEKVNPTDVQLANDKEPETKRRKLEWSEIRTKPNILDKDRERTLSKIATRGVVQLFNSVRTQQKDIHQRLVEAGPLEGKREKALKSIDKRSFIDMLKKKSEPVDHELKEENQENSKEKGVTWNVLRDDFMMGAKLKDWDKASEESDDREEAEISDSDSD